MSLYFTVIKSYWCIIFIKKQHCTSCWNSNVQHICYIICCLCQESLNLRGKNHRIFLVTYCIKEQLFMFQNVLLFIHLKMFKIGCTLKLNIIYCNKLCVACCSVWHRTITVHLVILMWITSCKISWVFTVNCMISSTVMWACCNV